MKKRLGVNNMGATETRFLVPRPEDFLRHNLAKVRAENQRDGEVLSVIHGGRFRGLFVEMRAVYPENIPPVIQLRPNVVFISDTMKVRDLVTHREATATDEFWGAHGYELLVRISCGDGVDGT